MKQQAKQKQTTQQKPRQRTAATNTHERQARMASARILSGKQDVSRLLTSAPAAQRVVDPRRTPRASRLPGTTRTVLETAFAADLGAVRLFYDKDAATLAAEAGARAFASGPDIFFADGQYQPHTSEGLRLIAHETAHVLQQTGRTDGTGRLHVTAQYGSGEIQRDEEWSAISEKYTTHAASESQAAQDGVAQIIRDISAVVGTTATLSTTLGRGTSTTTGTGSGTTTTNNMDAFEARVTSGEFDPLDRLARSLLLDVLKLLGRYRGAAHLLDSEPFLESTTIVPDFVAFLRTDQQYGFNWLTVLFPRIPQIAAVFPDRYYENVYRYLFNPRRSPVGTYINSGGRQVPVASQDINTAATTFFSEASAAETRGDFFLPNDRVIGAYITLTVLNADLATGLININDRAQSMPPAMGRLQAAREVVRAGEGFANHEHTIYNGLSQQMITIGQRAVEYWQHASALYSDTLGDAEAALWGSRSVPHSVPTPDPNAPPTAQTAVQTTPAPLVTPQAPAEVLRDPAFAAFATPTKTRLVTILSAPNHTLPTPENYSRDLNGLQSSLAQAQTTLGNRVFSVFRRSQLADQTKFDRAVWLGVGQAYIAGLLDIIGQYNLADDRRFVGDYQRDDVRLYHRFRIAWFANALGRMTNDPDLIALTDSIQQGADVERSYLALLSEWYEDRTQTSGGQYISRDFTAAFVVRGAGITANQLDRLYYLTNQEALNTILGAMLRRAEATGDLSSQSYGMIQRALRETRESAPMPTRWKMDKYLIVWNSNDAADPERENMSAMIRNHPRFQELLDMEDHRNEENLAPLGRRNTMYVWFLPDIGRVATYLYSLPVLNTLLENELGSTPSAENILTLLNDLWLRATREAHTEEDDLAFDDALADINASVAVDIGVADRQRQRLYQRATIHDRRVTANLINSLLASYADDSSVTNYTVPNRAIDLLDRFRWDIPIRSDDPRLRAQDEVRRDLQMIALTLQIASTMRDAFVRRDTLSRLLGAEIVERRYDIITDFYGYISRARDFIGGALPAGAEATQAESDAAARLGPILHSSENAARLVADAREPLNVLLDRFDRVISEAQRQFGFGSNPNATALVRVGYDRELPSDRTFRFEGAEIQVRAVHTDFVFHPSYGRGTDAYRRAIITHRDGSPFTDPHQALVSYGFMDSDETVTLYADSDEQTLEEFSNTVTMQILMIGMEELGVAIEYFMNTLVDVATAWIPGGPAARTMLEFIRFLAVEMPNIREQLLNDPLAVVRELSQFVSPAVRDQMLENLWMWILVRGDLPFEDRLRRRETGTTTDSSPAPTPTGRGKFARLAAFAKRVISRILISFLNLRDRVRLGLVRAHRTVVRYPLLQRILGAVPILLDIIDSLPENVTERLSDIVGAFAEGTVTETIRTQFSEALGKLFDGLNGLEVPTQIIPFASLVDVVVEKFFGLIKGVRGTIIRQFADVTGLRAKISEKIAEELDQQGLNPNRLWEGTIRDGLQSLLEQGRVALIDGINSLLRRLFGDQILVNSAGLDPVQVQADSSLPNLEGMLYEKDEKTRTEAENPEVKNNAAMHPVIPPAPAINQTEGVPLSGALREHYEQLFGHDFGHVRIHSGRSGGRLTAYFGARALTSGSHIFLASGLPPSSPRAEPVLRHELSHVLQQTGPRPTMLTPHDSTPRLSTPGRGLVVNPRREAAAERMAQRALYRGKYPVEVDEAGGMGLLPSVSTTVARGITNEISDEDVTLSFAHQIRSVPAAELRRAGRGFSTATSQANSLWSTVKGYLRRTSAAANHGHTNPDPFETSDALSAISGWFTRNREVDENIQKIAFYSRRVKADSSVELDRRKFLTNLEGFIYGATGVNVAIDRPVLTVTDEMPFTPQYAVVDNIDLGLVSANSNIYTKMKDNTNAHMGTGHFTQEQWWIIREAFKDDEQPAPIWHRTGAGGAAAYRLDDDYIAAMRTTIAAIGTGNVGPWTEYVQTGSTATANGHLRVATHGELTGSGARRGRQSHHVPQFLLVQYFKNQATINLASGGRFPAGVAASGGVARGFEGSPRAINFQSLDPTAGRGDGIPAVSLAARTHQRGRLHVNASSSWGAITETSAGGTQQAVEQPDLNSVEYKATLPQAVIVNLKFYDYLLHRMRAANPTMAASISSEAQLVTESLRVPQTYESAVYEAIRDTYAWMYGGMIRSLRVALNNEDLEAAEYRKSALLNPQAHNTQGELTQAYTPHVTLLAPVIAAVEEKNRQVMGAWRR